MVCFLATHHKALNSQPSNGNFMVALVTSRRALSLSTLFQVYASGSDVILLDGQLQHLQTIFGSMCGYGSTKVSCLHCVETTGRVIVAWGSEVVIFEPSTPEELSGSDVKGRGPGLSKEASTLKGLEGRGRGGIKGP